MSASREKRIRKENQQGGQGLSGKQIQARQEAKQSIFRSVIVSAVVALFLYLIVTGSGILQTNLTVLTVDGVKIKGAEFDFHYFMMIEQQAQTLQQMEVDLNRSLKRQKSIFGGTWADYIEEMVTDSLTEIVVQSEAAKRAVPPITLSEENIEEIDSIMEDFGKGAEFHGVSLNRFLRQTYGRGINEDSCRAILERWFLSDRYREVTTEAFDRSEPVIEAFYDEHKGDFDYIDYHAFAIPAYPADADQFTYDDELEEMVAKYTEDELEEYKKGQRAKAEEMLAEVDTSENFHELSLKYTEEEDAGEDSQDVSDDDNDDDDDQDDDDDGQNSGDDNDAPGNQDSDNTGDDNQTQDDDDDDDGGVTEDEDVDSTLAKKVRLSSLPAPPPPPDPDDEFAGEPEPEDPLAKFLRGAKPGDKEIIDNGDNFTVVLFVARYRDESIPNDVLHIPVMLGEVKHEILQISVKIAENPSNDVRHLLVSFDEFDTEDEARARAEELLEEWRTGEATEDSFAALASEHTHDPGSKDTGGLYEDITPETPFMAEFLNWTIDPARNPGDTDIIETSYGPHIMYYSKRNSDIATPEEAFDRAAEIFAEWEARDTEDEEDGGRAAFADFGGTRLSVERSAEDIDEAIKNWAADEAREPGDADFFEVEGGSQIVFYSERTDPEIDTLEKAREEADRIFAEWEEGEDPDRESFHALGAQFKSITDTSEDVAPEFRDWAVNDAREEDETEIIEIEDGYQIVYYLERLDPKWKGEVKNRMDSEEYQEHLDGLLETAGEAKRGGFGMFFSKNKARS
jgi:hypothetical protein